MFLKFVEDVLQVGWMLTLDLRKRNTWCNLLRGDRLQELGSLLVFGRILSRPYGVKKFQSLQMKRIPLFIEFTSGLYGFEPSWSMDQTHGLNNMNLGYV